MIFPMSSRRVKCVGVHGDDPTTDESGNNKPPDETNDANGTANTDVTSTNGSPNGGGDATVNETTVPGADISTETKELIPGLSNQTLVVGGALIASVLILKKLMDK